MQITFNKVNYAYGAGTPFEKRALYDITTNIPSQSYTAVIGHTGSGKSTFLQHLNALLQPTSGTVTIGDSVVTANKKLNKKQGNLLNLRRKVGVVFQFPEHQLFEETVLKDIIFGPLNYGVSEAEAIERAKNLIKLIGLPENILEKSPFDLSGGQMRRVAICGVLAMQPEILVLDEPTAGLDPRGRQEIMALFYRLYKEMNLTIVLVTHSMEDAAEYADTIKVMYKGQLVLDGETSQILSNDQQLAQYDLLPPKITQFQRQLEQQLNIKLPAIALTLEQFSQLLVAYQKEEEHA